MNAKIFSVGSECACVCNQVKYAFNFHLIDSITVRVYMSFFQLLFIFMFAFFFLSLNSWFVCFTFRLISFRSVRCCCCCFFHSYSFVCTFFFLGVILINGDEKMKSRKWILYGSLVNGSCSWRFFHIQPFNSSLESENWRKHTHTQKKTVITECILKWTVNNRCDLFMSNISFIPFLFKSTFHLCIAQR